MACYTTHRRARAKRYGSFYSRAQPENDVVRLAAHVRERHADRRHGADNEHRLVTAFSSGDLPNWFLSIRPATFEEDHAGVDAWVVTMDGDVAIQVKSSAVRAAQFRAKHPDYQGVVVVVHPAMPDDEIRWHVLKDVARVLARADLTEKKGKAA